MFRKCRLGAEQRGSNLVEMAMGLLVMVLLLAGVMDLGRVFNNYIIVTNASREGARRASRFADPVDDAYVKQAAIDEATNSGITLGAGNISVIRDPRGPTPGLPITVTVDYSMPTIMSGVLGRADLPMRGSSTMVVYGIQ